jgi:hypothetical protein
MNDAEKVAAQVSAYCAKYCIQPFNVSEVFDINSLRQKRGRNSPQWPNGDHAGCYVMYCNDSKLLNIGLAKVIARRLNWWFEYDHREDDSLPWTSSAKGTWNTQPKFAQTIAVNHSYEAPSLEAFLIGMLNPPENIHLKRVSAFSDFDLK